MIPLGDRILAAPADAGPDGHSLPGLVAALPRYPARRVHAALSSAWQAGLVERLARPGERRWWWRLHEPGATRRGRS
jgi:hypothetical protein